MNPAEIEFAQESNLEDDGYQNAYSQLIRLQMTLEVHSWEELYHCLRQLPFPEKPIEVRTVAFRPMRERVDYSKVEEDEE